MFYSSPFKIITQRKYNTWCKYTSRIDTYGSGCQHNCSYCYSKALLEFRHNWNYEKPKNSYISDIYTSISKLNSNHPIRMGSMTDCFQPLEEKEKITFETIKILNQFNIHYLIVTKSDLVSDDKYVNIYRNDLAHFQISITSTSNEFSSKFEKCSSISKRIYSIEKLYSLGFDVSIRLSPFIYTGVDYKVLNGIKCNKILIEFLKVNHHIEKNFAIDISEYTLKYGGHKNLHLDKKVLLLKNIDSFDQVSVGEYVSDHHTYFSNNFNYNKNDCCNLNFIDKKNVQQTELSFD